MKQYLDSLRDIRENGREKSDRTGTGTISLGGVLNKYDLRFNRLPVVTTKKIHLPSVIHELIWFISGDTNIKYLVDNGVKIWHSWADENGDLGPVYGKMWKDFEGVDQLAEAMRLLREDPDSRRNIVSSWNPRLLPDPSIAPKDNVKFGLQALPPCHTLYQFTTLPMQWHERLEYLSINRPLDARVFNERLQFSFGEVDYHAYLDALDAPRHFLTCHLYQRSGDFFLGVPFNITSYSLFTHMVAQCVNMAPYQLSHYVADAHIYKNHFEQVDLQLTREPMEGPLVYLDNYPRNLSDFRAEHIQVLTYQHHPAIKAPVAV